MKPMAYQGPLSDRAERDGRRTRFRIACPRPHVLVLAVEGTLDRLAALRLLRLLDARLRLIAEQQVPTRRLLIDLTAADQIDLAAVDILMRARDDCRTRRTGLRLIGPAAPNAQLSARAKLGQLPSFPSVDSALTNPD